MLNKLHMHDGRSYNTSCYSHKRCYETTLRTPPKIRAVQIVNIRNNTTSANCIETWKYSTFSPSHMLWSFWGWSPQSIYNSRTAERIGELLSINMQSTLPCMHEPSLNLIWHHCLLKLPGMNPFTGSLPCTLHQFIHVCIGGHIQGQWELQAEPTRHHTSIGMQCSPITSQLSKCSIQHGS